jgi:hypothetical protein
VQGAGDSQELLFLPMRRKQRIPEPNLLGDKGPHSFLRGLPTGAMLVE